MDLYSSSEHTSLCATFSIYLLSVYCVRIICFILCPPKSLSVHGLYTIMSYIMSLYRSWYLLSHSVLLQECFRYSWPFVIFIKMLVLSSSTVIFFWSFDCESIDSTDEFGEMWCIYNNKSLTCAGAHLCLFGLPLIIFNEVLECSPQKFCIFLSDLLIDSCNIMKNCKTEK